MRGMIHANYTNMDSIHAIEGRVKSLVKNEATGHVLGVQYIRKGEEYQEYVSFHPAYVLIYSVSPPLRLLPMAASPTFEKSL
jgi:hypothetical protein